MWAWLETFLIKAAYASYGVCAAGIIYFVHTNKKYDDRRR